jgi:hypothetical protein
LIGRRIALVGLGWRGALLVLLALSLLAFRLSAMLLRGRARVGLAFSVPGSLKRQQL